MLLIKFLNKISLEKKPISNKIEISFTIFDNEFSLIKFKSHIHHQFWFSVYHATIPLMSLKSSVSKPLFKVSATNFAGLIIVVNHVSLNLNVYSLPNLLSCVCAVSVVAVSVATNPPPPLPPSLQGLCACTRLGPPPGTHQKTFIIVPKRDKGNTSYHCFCAIRLPIDSIAITANCKCSLSE